MGEPYTGGCACGAVRYQVAGEPLAMNDCHCRQCQQQTGTGHGAYLTFSGAAVSVEGVPRHWEAIGDGGTVKHSAFCGECGSPVFLKFPAMPDVFIVRAGSLDDPVRYQPQMVFWTAAGHSWDPPEPGLTAFDTMPPAA